jgi:hypothetical protein
MSVKIDKRDEKYKSLFPEDIELYYEVFEKYINLIDENFSGAYELSKDALNVANRFVNLSFEASKLAFSSEFNKTDIKDFCYRKFKMLEYIHVQARMVWSRGVEREKLG